MAHLHPNRSDDDEIFQKYLDRAITEINELGSEIRQCSLCDHGEQLQVVMGTGHPLADVFMLKYQPRSEELAEGVAFFGAAGEAVLASVQRLNVNPLDIYGTTCVKCSDSPDPCMRDRCPQWLRRELEIVGPRLVIAMGSATVDCLNDLALPESRAVEWTPGDIQQWTPTCSVLVCPDIDESLSAEPAKRAFWMAFRELGDWYADTPPW